MSRVNEAGGSPPSAVAPPARAWWAIPLRAIVGYGFIVHGLAKLSRGPDGFAAVLQALGVPVPEVMAWTTILVELAGGVAIVLGAFVRVASIPMAVVLIVAMVTVHWPYGFSSIKLVAVGDAGAQFGPPGFEVNLLYLASLAALVLGGAGPLSIDALRRTRAGPLDPAVGADRGTSARWLRSSGGAVADTTPPYKPGLEGIVAAQTAISSVDGRKGELVIRGFAVEDLAPHATFEETVFLLWHDTLPDAGTLDRFRRELAAHRELERHTLDVLEAAATRRVDPMDALRMACGSLTGSGGGGVARTDAAAARQDALRLVAAFPVMVAAYHRLWQGLEPVMPRHDLGQAANFLYMLHGSRAPGAFDRALDTYWNTVVDHGLNASTFAARVIVSTESDVISAVTGAVGALKGPLHGGAPGPALDLVLEIGSAERAEDILREKLGRGERLMGFGHRVYRTRDPRADVLGSAAERLFDRAGDRPLYELARAVEACALRLLREHKPERALQTNVEFYTALVLHGLGFPTSLFTPVFAAGRVAGWTAHCLEQMGGNRLFRPQSTYVGARSRRWVPVGDRAAAHPKESETARTT